MLSARIKIYRIKDFIRLTESGQIDVARSKRIIHRIAAAAAHHADHNILLDLRGTTVAKQSFGAIMELALETARYKSVFRGKIANVIPDDKERIDTARYLKACMDIEGFQYEVFTDFEAAIEWLSDVEEVGPH